MAENKDIKAGNCNKQAETQPDSNGDVVSLARRRVMKVGVGLAPVILTLRGRALFGQKKPVANSVTMSANASRGVK